jgi:hypothetical protein
MKEQLIQLHDGTWVRPSFIKSIRCLPYSVTKSYIETMTGHVHKDRVLVDVGTPGCHGIGSDHNCFVIEFDNPMDAKAYQQKLGLEVNAALSKLSGEPPRR